MGLSNKSLVCGAASLELMIQDESFQVFKFKQNGSITDINEKDLLGFMKLKWQSLTLPKLQYIKKDYMQGMPQNEVSVFALGVAI